MAVEIRGMDHPVIAVRDMEQGRAAYERLGFVIPPRGSHLEWGTGNWCIMFADDYLELRGIVDATRYTHNLDKFLAQREGLMGTTFTVADAAQAYAQAVASGMRPKEPRELTRRFELPEGEVRPRFKLVYLDEADAPGLLTSLMIQHLTPELIRRPDWLDHPNGVVSVASMVSVVTDPNAVRPAYERIFGAASVSGNGHAVQVKVGRGAVIDFQTPAEAARTGNALVGAAAPYLAALTLRVRDPAVTEKVLARNNVPHAREADGALVVAPEHACGVILHFMRA